MPEPIPASDPRSDPLPDLRAGLRSAVLALRQANRGRSFTPRLRLGLLDLPMIEFSLSPDLPDDVGIRADIADALVRRALDLTVHPVVLLTRPGAPEPHDLDLAWLSPMAVAFRMYDAMPACLTVVTKGGWYAPFTGQQVTWKRLRHREHWYPSAT